MVVLNKNSRGFLSRDPMFKFTFNNDFLSIEQQEPKAKIPDVLVEHNSLMRGAIPCLPVPLAWFCLVWNVLLPGSGKSKPNCSFHHRVELKSQLSVRDIKNSLIHAELGKSASEYSARKTVFLFFVFIISNDCSST